MMDGDWMQTSEDNVQVVYEFVCIEELVPQDHMLRKIDLF